MKKTYVRVFLCICVLSIFLSDFFHGQQSPREWADEFNKLAQAIYDKENQPRGNPVAPPFDDYTYWMGEKAKDRDKIESLIEELTNLSKRDPENTTITDWIIRFRELLDVAQEFGNSTTDRAMSHMKIEDRGWNTLLMYAEELHPLYDKAVETRFAPDLVREFAQCLLRYASRDYECSFDSVGLYRDCTEPLSGRGIVDWRDGLSMDERCPRRQSDVEHEEKPQLPAESGLEYGDWLRRECDRWGFAQERSDLTDVMEDYYKDVLCKFPAGKGHKWYLEEAKKYKLDDAIDHNEGFYAKIYGKVEILTDEGRKPAPGAKVRVYAPLDDQEWTTTADGDGEYEIQDVILHKECSPFEISAEYKEHEEETEYEGPLEEPDESYEFEKDLLIKPYWEGTIESGFKLGSSGDESLITALVPKSKYQGITDWKLDVVFKLDRGNERVRIYELKSAKFSFSSTLEFEWKMEAKEGKFQTGGNWAAKEGRELSRSECDLELIIDLKKQTYKIEGILHVKNIAEKFKGEFELDVPPIHGGEKESDEQMIEHKEEILIEGEFSEDFPWELEGSVDEMKELPPEFQEFMEAWAGNITGKIRWKLDRKGKH